MTPKQRRFVEEYVVHLNATRAAAIAGYSKKTAATAGCRALKHPEIKKAIEIAIEERSNRLQIRTDEVLSRIMSIAFFNIANCFNSDGTLKNFNEIDPNLVEAICYYKRTSNLKKDGKTRELIRISSMNKIKCLRILLKYLGEKC